ncbi:repressor of yield of DENV homolog [Pelobates cultripes]|uniref:Repressor of yield of DENV homolog n=1 Tax=Pelobates cultripes TaxID=61616 RepID=A0AAD1RK50_PELCU|nr:repressor of yield of DENV homolog [Pelobates cultripes]
MQSTLQEELELEKSVRRLREKFYGKISVEKAVLLMRNFVNNHDQVCRYIVMCKDELDAIGPDEINSLRNDIAAMNVINNINNDTTPQIQTTTDNDIKDIARQLKQLPLTERNLKMFDNASVNCIPSEDRQFACKDCDKMWWRRVPERKQVSKCHRCKRKFDPIPRDKMWGIAEFQCMACNRSFKGHAQFGVASPCYNCSSATMPSRILPPRRNTGPRSRNQHSCYAVDCYNRKEPHVIGLFCVHPRSRARNNLCKVLLGSEPHFSTGSTVATCLSQGSLTQWDLDDIIMDDINEDREDSDS